MADSNLLLVQPAVVNERRLSLKPSGFRQRAQVYHVHTPQVPSRTQPFVVMENVQLLQLSKGFTLHKKHVLHVAFEIVGWGVERSLAGVSFCPVDHKKDISICACTSNVARVHRHL